jgi:hypothetical protein
MRCTDWESKEKQPPLANSLCPFLLGARRQGEIGKEKPSEGKKYNLLYLGINKCLIFDHSKSIRPSVA